MGADVLPYEVVCRASDDDWLEQRNQGIGGSDIAAVIGVSPWKGPYALYQEKAGVIEPKDLSDIEFIDWGKRLEPVILDAYQDRTGRPVRHRAELLRSKAHPWAMCTLDGETLSEPERGYHPLEIKTTNAFLGDKWVDGSPEHYRAQAHQQMLVTGAQRCTIAVLIGGNKLAWEDIDRDEALIRKIVHCGERFWRRVTEREPPPVDGTEASRRALAKAHPDDDGSVKVLDDALVDDIEELIDLKRRRKDIEIEKQRIENRLKFALGPATRGVFASSDLAVSWKTQPRKGYVVEPCSPRILRTHQPKR
jgi:putative phage-type endonuclease